MLLLLVIGRLAYDPARDPAIHGPIQRANACEAAQRAFMKAPRKTFADRHRVEQLDAEVTARCGM